MGYNASVLNIGTASYPSVGGALATLGWFFPFYLPLFAIPIGIMVIVFLDNPEPTGSEDLRKYLKKTWEVVSDKRAVTLFLATASSLLVLFGSYLTFFPLLLDSSFSAGSLEIGLIMSTMSITTALVASQLGKLAMKYEYTTLLKASYPFYALGLGIIPFVPHLYLFLVPTVIFGIGHGMNIPSILTLLAEHSPMESRGAFMSVNGLVLRLGQTIGPLLMGAIFTLGGFLPVYWVGAGLLVVTFFLLSRLL